MDGADSEGEADAQTTHTTSSRTAEKIIQRYQAPDMPTLREKLSSLNPADDPPTAESPGGESEDWIWGSCYSARKELGATIRLDFRTRSGHCFSLPYQSLMEVQFIPDEAQNVEWIKFDYTPYWHVSVSGKNLNRIYSLLQSHSVAWLREGSPEEQNDDDPFVRWIQFEKLTDPAVTLASLQYQREHLPGQQA